MSQLRALGWSIPRAYMRIFSDMIRRIRLRRRWPLPQDFERMGPVKTEAYIQSIGFDEEAREALAEYNGGPHQSRLGPGVPNAEGGAD